MASAAMTTASALTLMLLVLAAAPPLCEAGKLLFFMPVVSESMKICFMPLAEELVARGHEVTILMPLALKKPIKGIEVITVENRVAELHMNMSKNMLKEGASAAIPVGAMLELAMETNEKSLTHPAIKKLTADPKTKFDVVMVSTFFASEVGYYLAHRFDAELALFFTGQLSLPFMDAAFGQPHNPALVPLFVLDSYQHPMSFIQRVINTVVTFMFSEVARNWYTMGRLEQIVDKHFPEAKGKRPTLLEMEKEAAVGLHYGHPMIMDGLKPVAPNFQYIGMMNCRPAQALPKDLEQFMSSAEHGVIFVSFGSVIKASEMPETKLAVLLKVFGSLKQKVLWKWEKESMPGQPANVKLAKWLPQQDILGDPKTVAFVTHGGQSSFQECLCHQKPAVVIPVTGDQPQNGREVERMGFGISIGFQDVTEDNLRSALEAVISDPSYAQAAQERGSLLVDQETRPLDKAVWWLEFAMRHPGVGARHFRALSHDLSWYEVAMLDVLGFLILVATLTAMTLVACCRCLCGSRGAATQEGGTDGSPRKSKRD